MDSPEKSSASFKDILGSFSFDIFFTTLCLTLVSFFIPGFHQEDTESWVFFIMLNLLIFILYLLFFLIIYKKTIGMKYYSLYFNFKNFSILKTGDSEKINISVDNTGLFRKLFSIILDLILSVGIWFLGSTIAFIAAFIGSIPSGGFLGLSGIFHVVTFCIFLILSYYVFTISIFGRTLGMTILKIPPAFDNKFNLMFQRIFLVVSLPILYFIVVILVSLF